jgi:hypothetical protein
MAEYDETARRLVVKLVYYGPALSGKTTNLTRLHDLVAPELKGEMMTLETKNDRTLFFDLFPLGFRTRSGLTVKFRLFTVPGQVAHDGTRKAVLSRADGVAFIADSQRSQEFNNAASFENLADNSSRVGLDFERLPLVVQFNKRDLPDVIGEDDVRRRWAQAGWPLFFASAVTGAGVVDTWRGLLGRVYEQLNARFELMQRHDLSCSAFVDAALGKAQAA